MNQTNQTIHQEIKKNGPETATEVLFVCYPKCSTCQKARRQLENQGISFSMRDIKTENPTVEELTAWIARSGQPSQKFFNTSGLIYKEKNLKTVLPTLSEEQKLELLASDGMLVKRPLLITPTQVLVGYKEDSYAAL